MARTFAAQPNGIMKPLENVMVQSILFLLAASIVIAFVIYADCRWRILWDVACYWWRESPIF